MLIVLAASCFSLLFTNVYKVLTNSEVAAVEEKVVDGGWVLFDECAKITGFEERFQVLEIMSYSKSFKIGSLEGLNLFASTSLSDNFSNCKVLLTSDIDCKGNNITIYNEFNGTFDGDGHTISNFNLNFYNGSSITSWKQSCTGFFILTGSNSIIKNLMLKDFTDNGKWKSDVSSAEGGAFGGALVAYAKPGTEISNCAIIGAKFDYDDYSDLAGIVCGGNATITNCLVKDITVTSTYEIMDFYYFGPGLGLDNGNYMNYSSAKLNKLVYCDTTCNIAKSKRCGSYLSKRVSSAINIYTSNEGDNFARLGYISNMEILIVIGITMKHIMMVGLCQIVSPVTERLFI